MTARRSRRSRGGGRRRVRAAVIAAVAAVAVVVWAEAESWLASRAGYPPRPPADGRRVVVVLGYGNRGERANLVNRWRVRAGLRTLAAEPGEKVLLVTGGPVHSPRPEAEILAREARHQGWTGAILSEGESLSTVENIENILPMLAHGDRITIVSDPVHAVRARRILADRAPELAERLVPGADFRFGERPLEKIVGAVRGRLAGSPVSGGGSRSTAARDRGSGETAARTCDRVRLLRRGSACDR